MPLFERAGRPCARPARSVLTLALAITALAVPAAASAAPTVSYSMTATPTQGQPTNFQSTGTCDRAPCTYAWTDPGDGQSFGTGTAMTFTYNGTGSRTVKLAMRNTRGKTSSVTHSFTVNPKTTPPPPPPPPPADGDGDGTPDSTDQCPTQAGPASNHGCPTPPPPPPSTGMNCMPDPSSCGFPDVETTGVPSGTAMTAVNGTVNLNQNGQVLENKLVTGSIVVTAKDVTIRNVKLVVTSTGYGIQAFDGVSNLQIDHVEIDMNGHYGINGLAFVGFTASHLFIHNGSDCAGMVTDATIQDSLCVLGPDANDDGWPDSTSFCNGPQHFDGFQSDGGARITIRHNTIRNACQQTSSIIMSSNTSAIRDVTIQNNLMTGGGWTLYCNAGPDVPNEVITGNRFAHTYQPQYGPVANCEDADTFTGNVWDDNGNAL